MHLDIWETVDQYGAQELWWRLSKENSGWQGTIDWMPRLERQIYGITVNAPGECGQKCTLISEHQQKCTVIDEMPLESGGFSDHNCNGTGEAGMEDNEDHARMASKYVSMTLWFLKSLESAKWNMLVTSFLKYADDQHLEMWQLKGTGWGNEAVEISSSWIRAKSTWGTSLSKIEHYHALFYSEQHTPDGSFMVVVSGIVHLWFTGWILYQQKYTRDCCLIDVVSTKVHSWLPGGRLPGPVSSVWHGSWTLCCRDLLCRAATTANKSESTIQWEHAKSPPGVLVESRNDWVSPHTWWSCTHKRVETYLSQMHKATALMCVAFHRRL